MKPSALLISLLLASVVSMAQNPEIDSLRRHVKSTPKVKLFQCELCEGFARYTMIDSARECLSLSRKKQTASNEIKIRWELTDAAIAAVSYEYDSMKVHHDSALRIVRAYEPSFRIQQRTYTEIINNAAFFVDCSYGFELTQEFYEKANDANSDSMMVWSLVQLAKFKECLAPNDSTRLEYLEQAEAICREKESLLGLYYEEVAMLHYYHDRLSRTVEYALLAENQFQENKNESALNDLYWTFASAYEEMGDFERALDYLNRVKPMIDRVLNHEADDFYNTLGWILYRNGEIDSALSAIRKSEYYHRVHSPGNPEIAYPIGNLGLIYKEIGKLDSARRYSRRAVQLFESLGHTLGIAEALNNLGHIAFEQSEPDSALQFFREALEIVESSSDPLEEMNACEGLYLVLKERDPKDAIKYFQRYSELRVKLLSREEAKKALQIEAEFFQDGNEDRIRQLKYESQLKTLEIEQQRNRVMLATFALIIMAFVAGLIFFYWLQRRKMIRSLEESNAINRRIISMISHDFRGPLNNVKLTLELLQDGDMEMSEFLILSKDLYRQSSDLALMFDSFVGWAISQRDGYVPARIPFKWSDVVEEVISISQPLAKLKNIRIKLRAHSSVQVETDRMAASLILRNLLSNAIKYSHHDSIVEIDYIQENDVVRTTIKDRGIGMSQDKLQRILTTGDGSIMGTDNEYGAGLGLRMVIKYVRGIGGVIEATSVEDVGTTFVISIPVQLKRTDEF